MAISAVYHIGEDSNQHCPEYSRRVETDGERGLYLYVTVCIHTHMVDPFFFFLDIILSKSDLHVEKLLLSSAQRPRAAREVQAQRGLFE